MRSNQDGFPFPLMEGPVESENVTWLRNHSNYMAVRGPFDYVKAASVLVRGILVNFLIVVPYLLGFAIAVAATRFLPPPPHPLPQPPFALTKLLLFVFLTVVLLFAVMTPLVRISRFRRTRTTGSDSSVRQRGRLEEWYGAVLVAIVGAAAFEGLLLLLGDAETGPSWPTLTSVGAVVTTLFTVAPRVLSTLGEGLARKLALVAVGAVGLAGPLVVVMYAAHLLAFGPWIDWLVWAWFAAATFPLAIVAAAAWGWRMRAFERADVPGVIALAGGSIVLVALVTFTGWHVESTYVHPAGELHRRALAQLDSPSLDSLIAHVSRTPSGGLEGLGRVLGQLEPDGPGPPDPGVELPPPLGELAQAGWEADLYPGLGEIVTALAQPVASCGTGAGAPSGCDSLTAELEHLRARAARVQAAYQARSSPETLARALVSASRAGLVRDTSGLDAYPRTAAALRVDGCTPERGQLLPAICRVVRDQNAWERALLRVVDQLAVTASISVRGTPFYQTQLAEDIRANAFWPRAFLAMVLAVELGFFCWLTIDINLTSMHGVYRDRLAAAFLVGKPSEGTSDGEDHRELDDLDLMEICRYEAGSTAPYHLINTALNLQGSKALGVRDRKSDFFIFSKRFIGGERTGYCRSELMEQVFPQVDLSTAMAISAAAASPNMGRATNPALVAVMALLNIRLGFWVPNPGAVQRELAQRGQRGVQNRGYTRDQVIAAERDELERRWKRLEGPSRKAADGLVGIAFSGGGIRSATLNLGIVQALHRAGAFRHADYMSTVSGGGYLGSAISALMREGPGSNGGLSAEDEGQAARPDPSATAHEASAPQGKRRGQGADGPHPARYRSAGQLFRWRVRPGALVNEILGRLDEHKRWVNVSDGGHIENLAAIELLRRRCRYVIVGDGEADPKHHFNGLATLIRTARIDLGVEIDIRADKLRLDEKTGMSAEHWTIGKILYPDAPKGPDAPSSYLLYLKSSLTDDEDEVIRQYRADHPSFPHESTADQAFAEGQFEAYRSLGQHIGDDVLWHASPDNDLPRDMSFADLDRWFERLYELGGPEAQRRAASMRAHGGERVEA